MAWIIVIVVVVLVLLYLVSTYNKFVKLDNQSEESLAQIDAHLKQRFDMIPNLVEIVKGYAKHEKETLDAVITARNLGLNAKNLKDKDNAARGLSDSLKTVFALAESYPDLKANQGFIDLQKQLTGVEESLLQQRKYYNAVVKTFNTLIATFPNSVVASMFSSKFSKKDYLEIESEARENVKIKF